MVTLGVHIRNIVHHITCFSGHNVLKDRGEICLKPIGIAVNHRVIMLRYDGT